MIETLHASGCPRPGMQTAGGRHVDIRQLRNFLAVAEVASFTRAAESLHLSQPALSHSIAQLERQIGTQLFDRRRRSIALTAGGEALVPAARRAVRAVDDAVQAIAEVDGLQAGRVELAAPPALRSFPAARIIAAFRAEHPLVRVHVHEAADSHDVAARVLDGRAEVGLMDLGQLTPGLEEHPLTTYRIQLVAFTATTELPDPVSPEALASLPFVCSPPGTGTCQLMDRLGLAEAVVVEARSVDSILEHAASSRLCALMIEPYGERARAVGAQVRDLDPPALRRIGLVTRTGHGSAAVRELIARGRAATAAPPA
jgi:DNA-binding transcriptional LysR family regulator